MTPTDFAPMTALTAPASLAVNQRYVAMLSPLTLEGLGDLVARACYAKQTGDGAAFLIAFDQDGAYDSENFQWFKERYRRFVYIDRIVIGDALQRRGLARLFYEDLADFARKRGAAHLCAEVNVEPPNPASHAFHLQSGFGPVADGTLGAKTVRYYVKTL